MHRSLQSRTLIPLIEAELQAGKQVTFRVKGTSMRPFLWSNVTNITMIQPNDLLKRFDIVLYQNDQHQYVLHRIIRIKGTTLIIQGDALMNREIIALGSVIGVALSYETNHKNRQINQWHRFQAWLWHQLRFARRILLALIKRTWGKKYGE
ncbi:MAG: S24/S26 family peptidase [Candidatus Izemoplasmatales bacterium]|nr:S24/S26 family peptidase [Candidatus Izemoplasmatales bacterium]MDD5293135.1 S24/S26 family peptidase [Candidatus Izemoplasmatales bacterium]